MATTTPNFGWPVPTSTDLVKDGATAMEALGDAIDTSMVDLKGGTTGQVLAKASNADMDFSWTAPTTGDITGVTAGTGISGGGTSGDVTITNSMATAIDAKGDLVPGTGADTFARLAVGANGTVLTADSAEATGLKWATPAGGSTFAGCRVRLTANQSIANSTDQAITFTEETYDTDGYHSNVTNTSRLTIPSGKAGYYQINANIMWAANGTGIRDFNIYQNGVRNQYYTANPQSSNSQGMAMSTILYGAVGDYFEVYVFQNSGGALNIQSPGTGATSFSIGYLGA